MAKAKTQIKAPHVTPQQRAFVRYLVAGSKPSDAARMAGYGEGYPAAELAKTEAVKWEIRRQSLHQQRRLDITVDSLILEYEEAREGAMRDGAWAAAIAATTAKARLMGFLTEQRDEQERLTIPKPSPVDTKQIELSPEEWIRLWSPKPLAEH